MVDQRDGSALGAIAVGVNTVVDARRTRPWFNAEEVAWVPGTRPRISLLRRRVCRGMVIEVLLSWQGRNKQVAGRSHRAPEVGGKLACIDLVVQRDVDAIADVSGFGFDAEAAG